MSMRRKLLFSFLAIVVVLGVLELASATVLLIRGSSNRGNESILSRRFQPLRYELPSGMADTLGNGPTVRINDVGLRGPNVETPKMRTRILCVGDSCTFGYAPDVTDDKTYPALLGQRLNQRHPHTFEVVNGGMPNYGVLDCMNYFLYKGAELGPDYVVIMCGWNDSQHIHDLQRSYHIYGMPTSEDQANRSSRFVESFATNRLARRVWRRLTPKATSETPPPATRQQILGELSQLSEASDAISTEAFARSTRILRSFVHLTRAQSAQPILVTLPHFTQRSWTDYESLNDQELELMQYYLSLWSLSPQGWHTFVTRTNDATRRVAKELHCPLVEGSTVSQPELFADTCHLNASGNDALASLVETAILEKRVPTKQTPAIEDELE